MMGFVMSVLVAILMLWVVPQVQWYRKLLVLNAHSRFSIDKVTPRHFQDIGQGVILYSQQQSANKKQLKNVFVARLNKKDHVWQLLRSATAHETALNKGHYIVFNKGTRFDVATDSEKYQQTHFQNYGYRLSLPSYDIHNYLQVIPTIQLIHATNKALM